MSILYRPSKWVRDDKTGRMVKVTTGKRVRNIFGNAVVKSQLNGFQGG